MKKVIVIVLAVIGIVSLMIAGSALEPAAVAKEQKKKEVITWIGQTDMGPGNPMFASAQRMCEAITTVSGGRLKLTVEPAGAVVPGNSEFDAVDAGTIDFAFSLPVRWGDLCPARELFGMRAGGMSPMGKYLWFISGGGAELAQEMIDDQGYNVHLIPSGGLLDAPALFLHSRDPVNELADLEELKLRAAGDSVPILNLMDASAIFLPGGEIYAAMQEEPPVIDAFEYTSPYINWQMGFYEIAAYVYVSGCREPGDVHHFIVNQTRWNELPGDLKAIVQQVSNEEALTSYGEKCQLDIEALAKFRGYGCVVEMLSSEIEEAFVLAANEYYDDQAIGKPFYAEVLQSLRHFEEALDAIGGYDKQCQEIYSWSAGVI